MSNDKSAYLKAMGIDVWLERSSLPEIDNISPSIAVKERGIREHPHNNSSFSKITDTSEKNSEVEILVNKADIETVVEELDYNGLVDIVSSCQKCALSESRNKTIFSTGKQSATLMVIGDTANQEDETLSDLFTGKAGELLTAMLKAIGFRRNDVYITNMVKCHLPQNKELLSEYMESCEAYLLRQINLLQPKVVLVLGSIAAQSLLKNKSSMTRLRGQEHYLENINIPIVTSFHPTYLLASPNEKRKAWQDLKLVMKLLNSN